MELKELFDVLLFSRGSLCLLHLYYIKITIESYIELIASVKDSEKTFIG